MGRATLCVDSATMYRIYRACNWKTDFGKLLKYIKKNNKLVGSFYFSQAPPEWETLRRESYYHFKGMLTNLGFTIIDRPGKMAKSRSTFEELVRYPNMTIDLTLHLLTSLDSYDEVILLVDDEDLIPVFYFLRNKSKKIIIIGLKDSIPEEVKKATDEFKELSELKEALILDVRNKENSSLENNLASPKGNPTKNLSNN
jgi:uncharacterized LabA/DUF88 family protein